MDKRNYAIFLGAALAIGLVGCSDDDGTENSGQGDKPGTIELTSTELDAVAKYNKFGFNMLDVVGNSDDFVGKNIIISPVSFNYAFSMLANGAAGETRSVILDALGYDALSIDEVNSLNQKLSKELGRLDSRVTVNFANSLWATPTIPLHNNFVSTLTSNYDAEVHKINADTYVKEVNDWCFAKTNGKITDFLSDTSVPDFALFNASYFKGIWSQQYKFDSKHTASGVFYNIQGGSTSIKYMNNTFKDDPGALSYNKTETMQKCELSFGNGSFGAAFILPDEDVTISQAIENLANGDWDKLCKPYAPEDPAFGGVKVNLTLPKFKIESEVRFESIMEELGLADIYASDADFSNMSDVDLTITQVLQKSTFEVDEEGAVAASVTEIGMESGAYPPKYYDVTLKFNRPFIYVLYEHSTGAILFAGCVNTFAN
ncbi:MAG: serpin family protein [Bacteroidales bacterium]|nr:serpin family protein [Bacteroidales bacterium]MBD5258961.1 serpin family protein [Barnesiella sp.]